MTDKTGGTGLGLAIVKQTVLAHGGRVEAESTRGSGNGDSPYLPGRTTAQRRDDGHFARAISERCSVTVFVGTQRAHARDGRGRDGWRTSSKLPVLPAENAERMERMERAIDAVAVEVERISENQRFLTKLLAERGEARRDGHAAAARLESRGNAP